ncbi:TPR repeat-containing thioredoxin TDX [Punica granatum]|uniref:TPR repeat-containing thioredoxin TDX n=1 Tax=Punica granatum TaxID=22663 RepID=A0A6P8EPA4_PUNGR|nr:TPR repeat-containing thioredoxin TDX [Punica granatum]
MEPQDIEDVKLCISACKLNPAILHDPSLGFFRAYLQSLGARVPPRSTSAKGGGGMSGAGHDDDSDIVESDVELDESDVVVPDDDPPQRMGDPSAEITEEKQEAAQVAKSKAMDAISEGKLDEAIDRLTEAILLNPNSAILYAARANAFIKLKKPNAAICDAEAAFQINPDSAKAFKARGMAKAMLGRWDEAASDLQAASKLDHDEEISAVLKKVEANRQRIQEHRRRYEDLRKRKQQMKAEKEKQQAAEEALSVLKDGQVIGIHSLSEVDTKLNAASRASRLAILYFTATWCGPCRFISPLFTSLAAKYLKVVFLKVHIDEARDVAARWNISSVPTFFFVRDGKEVDKLVGADKGALEIKIAEHAR